MTKQFSFAALSLVCACAAAPALADHDHHGGPWPPHHGGWHGDIQRFHEQDAPMWRRGNWYHGHHDGRNGWWWIVNGLWYFYAAPVYPYPDPYLPPEVAPSAPPAPPAPPSMWYYCRHPAGYYPYVPACRHWEAVPARP